MNFFGHVVVSSWHSDDPAVALGSMLPDFANMLRGRVMRGHHPRVAEGLALHHETDRVFHVLPEFTALERDTAQRLQRRGVHRGGAMGVAHVGVELLIDGLLLDDEGAAALYLAALDCQPARSLDAGCEWRTPEQARRWSAIRKRLSDHGLPDGFRDPDVVCDRVAMILTNYQSLALDSNDVARVRAEMHELRPRVARAIPAMLAGLRREVRATAM